MSRRLALAAAALALGCAPRVVSVDEAAAAGELRVRGRVSAQDFSRAPGGCRFRLEGEHSALAVRCAGPPPDTLYPGNEGVVHGAIVEENGTRTLIATEIILRAGGYRR